MPVLFLIPSPIGDTNQLPPLVKDLRRFVVENLRETRRFLRSNFPDFPIDDCHFLEINLNSPDIAGMESFLKEAQKLKHDVGLLSDAGVPCVADPGALVVKKAHDLGFVVNPLVGPSSLLMALMASGFNGQCFAFHGYLPIPEPEQQRFIRQLEEESARRSMTQMFIETPYRNNKLVQQLLATLKSTTRLCVACDLDSPTREVISMTVKDWQERKYDFHKRPAVFLLYAR